MKKDISTKKTLPISSKKQESLNKYDISIHLPEKKIIPEKQKTI